MLFDHVVFGSVSVRKINQAIRTLDLIGVRNKNVDTEIWNRVQNMEKIARPYRELMKMHEDHPHPKLQNVLDSLREIGSEM